MIYLPDTNACIALLRQRNPQFIARWQATKPHDIVLCSVTVYELRHGAERSPAPTREHARLDAFLSPYASPPFDDATARHSATIRHPLERSGQTTGPDALQIAAVALQHRL